MSKRNQYGLTIVELSVVIAVIGILVTIGIATYAKIQKESTATQRETAATAIADSLEKYYEKNGEYPTGSQINPASQRDYITDYTGMLSVLPGLTESNVNRKGNYQLYAYCDGAACSGGSWLDVRRNQIVYHSRSGASSGPTVSYSLVSATQSLGGSSCTLKTYYEQPGFALSWYDEAREIWVFKRSLRGTVEITNNASPPSAPQTCVFS